MNKVEDLTVDELLGIASKDGSVVPTLSEDRSNITDYIREQGVKDGSVLVPNFLVYYDYCRNWKPAGFKLSKIGFLRKFNVAFKSKRKTKVRYYLLESDNFDLSPESIRKAKDFDLRYRNKITRKKK